MFKAIDTLIDLVKAGFKPLDEGRPRHFSAIGRFITAVSNEIDTNLYSCLASQIAGTEESSARIIVGEMRTGDVTAAIKRIVAARPSNAHLTKDIEVLFAEIAILRKHRDIVAHRTCMVSRSKLAFHNAMLAKSDPGIEVNYYTLRDLNEFSKYAKRLGMRITALSGRLIPLQTPPANQALLTLGLHNVLQLALIEMAKSGKIKGKQLQKMKDLEATAHEAVKAYAESARKIDGDFAQRQNRAAAAVGQLSTAILLVDAPEELALCEIPARLQKKLRPSKKMESKGPRRKRSRTTAVK